MALDTVAVCGLLGVLIVVVGWLVGRIYIPEWFNQKNIIKVKSKVDGREWNVQGDLPCPECAADSLATLNQDIEKMIEHLKRKYPNDPRTHRLITRYDPNRVYEGRPSPGGLGDTSYTLNKGQRVVFCARSGRDVSKLIDQNTLKYVSLLHELSHILSEKIGHGKEFNDNMLWLAKEAVSIGLYDPVDYRRYPKEFCGIMINQSILF